MGKKNHPLGFLLLHGGGMEAWVWDKVLPHLALPACAARRVPPGGNVEKLTVADCADYALAQADAAGFSQVITVAHSIAGILAPEIALRAPGRVAHLAFIAANIPAEGKTALSVFSPLLRLQMEIGARLMMWGLTPDIAINDWMRENLANGIDKDDLRRMMREGKNLEPFSFFQERISRKGLPPLPRSYIKLTEDRALPPEVQDEMAANIGARVTPMDTGHMAMLGRPKELAAMLNGLVDSSKVINL